MVTEQEKLEVVQGEGVESMVVEVVLLPGVLVGTRKEGLRMKGVTIPFVGETPTGGERTKFLPRSSKDYSKPHPVPHNHSYSWYQRSTIVGWRCQEYKPHPVPQGWSRTKDTHSDSSQPRTVQSRSSYEARSGVEPDYRRLHHTPSHQRCQLPLIGRPPVRCPSRAELDERRVDPVIDEAIKVVSSQV